MTDAYGAAGVNIDAANETVDRYRSVLERHADPRVLQGIGAFSGSFAMPPYNDPVLVASTDGVGTKVLVAAALGRYDTIGADLVNHCVNDVLCSGAQPLFFLDYLAMGKLDPDAATTVVASIAEACTANGIALLGGETAEMPGVYTPPHFDIAGTIVGAGERDQLVDTTTVDAGDIIIGLPANGLHTNGYSLARATVPQNRWHERLAGSGNQTIADALLATHPSYLPHVRAVRHAHVAIKSMAHITGGGLIDNLPRAFGEHLAARLNPAMWRVPPIIELIMREARMPREDAHRAFNMGIGFCMIVAAADGERARKAAQDALERHPIEGALQTAAIIGEIEPRGPCGPSVIIGGQP